VGDFSRDPWGLGPAPVDLHVGHPRLDDRDPREVARRTRRVPLGAIEVRVLGPEDHLRLVALHLFEHATWRCVCLVDVAVLVEALAAELDLAWLLDGDPRRTEVVTCALGLAAALLDAHLPAGAPRPRLPRWLPAALLTAWGTPFRRHPLFRDVPRTPGALLAAARLRWRNPIVATTAVGGRFDDGPRWPYQVADFALRGWSYLRKRTR
jgi:hypothetical protein